MYPSNILLLKLTDQRNLEESVRTPSSMTTSFLVLPMLPISVLRTHSSVSFSVVSKKTRHKAKQQVKTNDSLVRESKETHCDKTQHF